MATLILFIAFGLLSLAAAASGNCTLQSIVPSKNLTWCPCDDGFLCARLDVPLDYQNPSAGRASVPLTKLPAVSNSSDGLYQGMILINPGGPGVSGIGEVLEGGALLHTVVGSNWDVVGFDPRGINNSLPSADCSVNGASNQSEALQSRVVPRVSDKFYQSWIDYGNDLGAQCNTTIGKAIDAGPHMSTAVVVRDMVSIVDAFAATSEGKSAQKNSSLLNYYGVSYGSFLGQTFASMFPDRVGNVVIDGIVSPAGYLNNFTYGAVTHQNGILAAFFIYCHEAGPQVCSYDTGSTPKDVYDRFNSSFVQLEARKAAVEKWSNATEIESALLTLKIAILTYINRPLDNFGWFPGALQGLETAIAAQNLTAWTQQLQTIVGDPTPPSMDSQWQVGVQCSDQGDIWYGKTLEDFRPQITFLESQSVIGEIWLKGQLGCAGWSIKATERYSGPFAGDTATPILFVSNTYDPNTAIENSFSSAPNYKGAQILTIDGMGETCRKNHVDPSRSTQNAANSGEHVVQAQHESAMQEKEALSSPTSTSTVSQDHPADRHYDQDHAYNAQKSTGAIAKAEIAATNTASGAEEDDDDFPEGGLQAWLVVLGSFSAQFIIYGIINSTGALQAYLLQNELKNSDPEQVAWIFSINLFMVFFCGIYAGRIFDTRGPRGLVAVGSGCLVLSMFLLSLCTEYWHFLLDYSILGGIGGALLNTPAFAATGHFFKRRRGLATGVSCTAGSIGGIVIPLMLRGLIPTIGFAWSARVLGFLLLALAVPANLFIKARLAPSKEPFRIIPDFTAYKNSSFGLCVAGIFLMEWGLFVALAYLSPYVTAHGQDVLFGFTINALLNVGSFFGRFIPGFLADRLGRFNVIIVTIALCAITVLALWLPAGDSVAIAVVFAITFGFASGTNLGLIPVCLSQLCRVEEYGRYYSAAFILASFGTLTSVPIGGALLSTTNGSYWGLIVFCGLAYVAALCCYILSKGIAVGWSLRTIF